LTVFFAAIKRNRNTPVSPENRHTPRIRKALSVPPVSDKTTYLNCSVSAGASGLVSLSAGRNTPVSVWTGTIKIIHSRFSSGKIKFSEKAREKVYRKGLKARRLLAGEDF